MFGERETLGREALRKMPKYVALAEDDTDLVAFVAQVQAGNAKTRPVDLPPAPAFTRHHTIARIRLPYPPKPASEPTSISSAGDTGGRAGKTDSDSGRTSSSGRPSSGKRYPQYARAQVEGLRTEEDPHVGFECEQHVSESTPLERSRPALLHSPPSREPSILHSGAGLTPLTSVRGETDTRTRKGGAPSGPSRCAAAYPCFQLRGGDGQGGGMRM
ncbi:hypothetical protein B0H17DRAFT_1339439 [Mycena rosella]|uniref:Uncharacterized protein n=1 Tax=Mycena rosella TaxID=1033263 RepID=A0AAD7FTY8_MYCRO|nr:hypothetical protein B0H17DRAFT_1339439 [Mycena rosella]